MKTAEATTGLYLEMTSSTSMGEGSSSSAKRMDYILVLGHSCLTEERLKLGCKCSVANIMKEAISSV